MPLFIFFVVLILVLSGLSGDVNKDSRYTYQAFNPQLLAWDQEQLKTQQAIRSEQKQFHEMVAYYRSMIDNRLSEGEMEHLVKEANRFDVPVEILLKLLKIESNFTKDLVGPPTRYGHAYGMAQFMENTAPWIADMANLEYKFEYLFDPYYSITLAAVYLNYLQYGDGITHDGYQNWHTSLTAYNRGMGGLRAYQRKYQTTVSAFSRTIIAQANEIIMPDSEHSVLLR